MLEASSIYSFKKGGKTYSLFVNSVQRRSEYWIGVSDRSGAIETTEKVYSWDDALGLLESYDWARYESDKIDILFADLIAEARGRNGVRVKSKDYNAQERLLNILKRLEDGQILYMDQAVEEFNVSRATIQRDIDRLRGYFLYSNKEIPYLSNEKGYKLDSRGDYFTIDDCLIVLLFLYGTRAFNKEELQTFSKKMIGLFSLPEQIKLREFFNSYLYHYKPVQEQNLFDMFYTSFQAISEKRILKFTYTNNKGETGVKEVVPYTFTYHDGKFYLLAAVKGREEEGPRSWLMDKMKEFEITKLKFSSPPLDLTVAEYVQKAFNMYNGDPVKTKLKVAAANIEFLKRKFPVVSINGADAAGWFEVELETLGIMGIELWVLQQGPHVEVLEPLELRENVKKRILEMHKLYAEESSKV